MAHRRSERVSDEIMREVSGMIVRGEIKDPRVSGVFVTGVKITENLSMAEVFFTVLGGEAERSAALEGLEHSKGFIRSRLAKKIRMKKIPDIKFSFDQALETGYRVDEILRGITRGQ
ncbi:MAG TPA: 30S ribosome-binding factor RbfA [Thermodesulfobacteriota bacterium]|nr:30S ribosome-binding factor RbfA [Thermodesulfobacteriota bacterium]